MELLIGVCDDDQEQIDLINHYLLEYRDEFEIKFIGSTDPLKFLSRLDEYRPDLVFLDIDMDNLDGINLGRKIKKKYSDTIIIYITAYEEYALAAFQVRAFHYLVKPITTDKFLEVFKEAISSLKKDNGSKKYTVKKKGEYVNLAYNNIYYFEKAGHRVKISTENGNIFFYKTFKKLVHEIDMDLFIRCHQGYIVNISKIRAYRQQKLFLEGDIEIPVSRSNIKKVKEMMEDKLFS